MRISKDRVGIYSDRRQWRPASSALLARALPPVVGRGLCHYGDAGFQSIWRHLRPMRQARFFLGRGIAARLLKAIETHLRQMDIVRLRLSALASNASARTSYERVGYVPYEVVYEKVLEPEHPL
ncbi:GNAT family N-acetyltransferase [Rhodoblastus sp.]|uniref:GNAT family N-acetyltransferase n=1 Tax=Rhodoblastus sp. TaxID=1962975 RepID=UPI003F9535EE